ncbi:MAG: bifunctional glutamate N-acetyltransferase/amino-acid acetyltransferase ArgJ [Spirochaetaceae bacterium]|jgi:glutamate N-acetyltransferase/amino-acid N-acetyltransferase|nr:bifunctional glutamate N-acetyltransferase/amino-acid acetyltransferase ArgJ [Spirochaetaceae bacterium]
MKEIKGGVCAARGFRAGGVWCGIKASDRKRDLGLIYSEKTCTAAALFTTNLVKAASVLVSAEHLKRGRLHGVIANSGNANACTGEAGIQAARRMAALAADEFALSPGDFAVASTGVIGVPLPIEKIEAAVPSLVNALNNEQAGHDAALEAIMTTDTRRKDIAVECEIAGKAVRFGAMTKGSGMIHPSMATMLCFISTDCAIRGELLDRALRKAAGLSFNRLSVDGDTSTNDMVLVMANGASGNEPIEAEGSDYKIFEETLTFLCVKLARAMARDGEGATKLVTVKVSGAGSEAEAETLAKSVVSSSLVKAACFGADANWGRVLCAMGYAGVSFNPDETSVDFAGTAGGKNAGLITVFKNGIPVKFSEEEAKRVLSGEEIEIRISAGSGSGFAEVWGCDLSYDYVKINGDYRS